MPSKFQAESPALGVEHLEGRVLTGSVDNPLAQVVKNRAHHYWAKYQSRPDLERLAPEDMSVVIPYEKLSKGQLDETGMERLLATLNARIELDDGANRLAAHLMSHKGQSGKPSIKSWTESYRVETMEDLGWFFYEVQSRLSPGWAEVLNGGTYDRPTCFLASVAYKLGYTVEELRPVVERFFVPERRPTSLGLEDRRLYRPFNDEPLVGFA
ncbi:hypothetical protein BDZ89DRAFT_1142515 [Hymenopellis radicata]|nr:hypothetical protein BDZ89DRAFT_1142515 [Hymenopellis radicata]